MMCEQVECEQCGEVEDVQISEQSEMGLCHSCWESLQCEWEQDNKHLLKEYYSSRL